MKGKQRQVEDLQVPLSPSLIHYVFFPLSQLLRSSSPTPSSSNETGLPGRVLELIFECLSHLAKDWWRVWAEEEDSTKSQVSSLSSKRGLNGKPTDTNSSPNQGSSGTFGNQSYPSTTEGTTSTPFSTRFIPSKPLPDPNLLDSQKPELEDLKKKFQIWEQLLILGTISLGGSPNAVKENQQDPKKKSDETKLSILRFLNELLRPQFSRVEPASNKEKKSSQGEEIEKDGNANRWEWDGISDLPSLDEFDSQQSDEGKAPLDSKNLNTSSESSNHKNHFESSPRSQLYPSSDHLLLARSPTPRGALAHLLTTCLNLSCGSSRAQQISTSNSQSQKDEDGDGMLEMRELALTLSGRLLRTWIGGVKEVEIESSWNWSLDFQLVTDEVQQEEILTGLVEIKNFDSEEASSSSSSTQVTESTNLRIFLPGFISSMTRMISNSTNTTQSQQRHSPFANVQNSKSKTPASAKMQSIGLDQIREILSRCLRDDVTLEERKKLKDEIGVDLKEDGEQEKSKFTSLEDFADLNLRGEENVEENSSEEQSRQTDPQPQPQTQSKEMPTSHSTSSKSKSSFLQSSLPPLHSTLISLSTLVNHSSPRVQASLLLLAFELLHECHDTLKIGDEMRSRSRAASRKEHFSQDQENDSAQTYLGSEGELEQLGREKSSVDLLLGWILDLTSRSNTISDRLPVLASFLSRRFLISSSNQRTNQSLLHQVFTLAQASFKRLPKSVQNKNGSLVMREVGRVQALLTLVTSEVEVDESQTKMARDGLSIFLGPDGKIEEWAFPLMDCLALSLTPIALSGQDSSEEDGGDGWSRSFQNLEDEPKSGKQVREMFKLIGRSIGNLIIKKVKSSDSTQRKNESSTRSRKEGEDSSERLFHSVFYFLGISASQRSIPFEGDSFNSRISLTAALFADEIIQGIALVLGDEKLNFVPGREGKTLRKISHKFGKEIQRWVSRIWEEDGVEGVEVDGRERENRLKTESTQRDELVRSNQPTSEAQTQVQHIKGTDQFPDRQTDQADETSLRLGGAIDLSFVKHASLSIDPKSNTKLKPNSVSLAHQHTSNLHLSTLLQLSMLSSSSKLLGLKFRPFLQNLLYPLVASLAANSSNTLIPSATFRSLKIIAKESGYGDLRNLIMSNSDWILGESSWRLVNGLGQALESGFNPPQTSDSNRLQGDRSAPSQVSITSFSSNGATEQFLPLVSALTAPLVLVQTLKLLGSEALPLVEDAIDEVLDALDRFHGHETICEGLWNVLDGVVECMLEDKKKEEANPNLEMQPNEDKRRSKDEEKSKTPFDHFEKWYRSRSKSQKGKGKAKDQEEAELPSAFDNPQNSTEKDDQEPSTPPATRSQEVLISILSKSVPFLSHSSSFLRSRVLRLLSNGIQILSNSNQSGSSSSLSPGVQRSEDLLPILNRAWPLIMSRLGISSSAQLPDSSQLLNERERRKEKEKLEAQSSEREHLVWLESINLLNSISQHVNEFLGKQITEDVWPRMEFILERIANGLRHQKTINGKRLTNGSESTDSKIPRQSNFFLIPSHSLQAEIYVSIFKCLSSNITSQGPLFSEETSFQILMNPFFTISLDVRQDVRVRAEALQLLENLGKFNPDSVWMVLRQFVLGSGDQKGKMDGGDQLGRLEWLKSKVGSGLSLVDGRNEVGEIFRSLYLK